MKAKKAIIFLLVVIVVAFYSMAYSTVIYEEDFQNDPGWSSTDQSNIYWDDSNEYYFVRCKTEGGNPYWAYSPVFSTVSSTDISFSFDIRPYDATWGTFPQVTLIQEGSNAPRKEYSLKVTAHYSDTAPKKFRLIASDGIGGENYLFYADSPTFDESKWYHHEITYDMSANTVTWNITERDTGESFYTTTFNDVEKIYDFNQIAIGTQRNEGGANYGDWATILVDNIELSTTGCDCTAEYQAGMQYCIDNPSACGISPSGPTDSIPINSDLSFSFDATYSTPFTGDMDLGLDFTFFGDQNGTLLWKLDNFTVK